MFFFKLSTNVVIAVLVAALVLGALPAFQVLGLAPGLRAAQVFLDDFQDGNIMDGNPVNWIAPSWIPNGEFRIENGDLILTPSNIPPALPGYDQSWTEMDVLAEGVSLQDVSLRTQIRGLSAGSANAPYWIGITARDTYVQTSVTGSTISAGLRSDGLIAMTYLVDNVVNGPGQDGDIAPRVATGLNFVNEDVNLQLDLVGNQARLTVWAASQPRPTVPQLRGTVPNALVHAGSVGLFAFPRTSDWNKPAAFRYVELISIPEPSSLALGSLGVALASFAFRNRLVRTQRP